MEIINDTQNYAPQPTRPAGDPVRTTVRATELTGGILRSGGDINIGNRLVKIDTRNPKIVINSGTQDTVLIGKRSDGTYGLDVAKPGVDVNGAAYSNLFYSDRIIKVSYKFAKEGGNVAVLGAGVVSADGWLQYHRITGTDVANFAQYIKFYKETNLTIESCVIQTIWYDGYKSDLTTRTRPGACTMYLNPTVSAVTEDVTLAQRFSGGTTLVAITPNADGYTNTETLSASEISSVTDGWNTIAIQVDSATITYDEEWGAVAIDVSIRGYLTT